MSRVDPTLTADRIKRAVAQHYSVPVAWMDNRDRRGDITLARMVAMYLCRALLPSEHSLNGFQRIAGKFDRKDHTTVIHAVREVESRIANDPETARAVRHLKTALAEQAGRWAA
jgi:chromosomal replication initiator protein